MPRIRGQRRKIRRKNGLRRNETSDLHGNERKRWKEEPLPHKKSPAKKQPQRTHGVHKEQTPVRLLRPLPLKRGLVGVIARSESDEAIQKPFSRGGAENAEKNPLPFAGEGLGERVVGMGSRMALRLSRLLPKSSFCAKRSGVAEPTHRLGFAELHPNLCALLCVLCG
jgi:hypothetical protein